MNVDHIKFGRDVKFDERSRQFPLTAMLDAASKKQRSFTWRCKLVFNQGSEGSCVGHAWTHELVCRPAPVMDVGHKFAVEEIYWNAQRIDPWKGGAYPGASPFYEGSNVLAGAKAVMMTGYISGYRWAFSLDELIYGVGHYGPAVLGINWYSAMSYPDIDGRIKVAGNLSGGHAILCNGVNIKRKAFILHNSWGRNWGIQGEAEISFDDMDRLLHEQGEACFAIGRRTKPLIVEA